MEKKYFVNKEQLEEDDKKSMQEIIDDTWIKEYIEKNGTKIVIPKEAKVIKKIGKQINKMLETQKTGSIELIFEEGSELETIEDEAFEYCSIRNRVVFPENLRKIGKYAFSGSNIKFSFPEHSRIEECNEEECLISTDCMVIPSKNEKLEILGTEAKKIVIPDDSQIKQIITQYYSDAQKIILSDGEIVCDEDEKILYFERTKDRYNLICSKGVDEVKSISLFVSIDRKTREKVFENEISRNYTNVDKLYTLEYDNIWDVNLSNLDENLMLPVYIKLKSDNKNNLSGRNGWQTGRIYTIEEIREIQNKLKQIVSKVNIPRTGILNREKIIYAQIINQLYEYVQYDYESADIIENDEYYNDKEKEKQADETQNLKGLIKGKTVCKGLAKIVEALSIYFDINCTVVSSNEHAWNLVTLDGENYEDDFTWYENDLQTSNILGMEYFLKGINEEGQRSFQTVPYHQSLEDFHLSKDLPKNQRFNLLTTNWSKVKDWEKVNIDKPIPNYMCKIDELVKSKKTMCLLAKNYINNCIKLNVEFFMDKVKSFFKTRGDDNYER